MRGDFPGIFDFRKERRMREELGFTRKDLSRKLGPLNVNIRTMRDWETGVYAVSLDAANLIATLFDCYLDDFLKDGYVLQ